MFTLFIELDVRPIITYDITININLFLILPYICHIFISFQDIYHVINFFVVFFASMWFCITIIRLNFRIATIQQFSTFVGIIIKICSNNEVYSSFYFIHKR